LIKLRPIIIGPDIGDHYITAYKMLAEDFAKSANFTIFTEKVSLDAADALAKKIEKAEYMARKVFFKSEKPIRSFIKIFGPDRSNEDNLRPGFRPMTLRTYCAAVVYVDKGGELVPVVIDPLLSDIPRDVREWGTLLTQDYGWYDNPEMRHTFAGTGQYNFDWNNAMK
jgi:hypothetical protein